MGGGPFFHWGGGEGGEGEGEGVQTSGRTVAPTRIFGLGVHSSMGGGEGVQTSGGTVAPTRIFGLGVQTSSDTGTNSHTTKHRANKQPLSMKSPQRLMPSPRLDLSTKSHHLNS